MFTNKGWREKQGMITRQRLKQLKKATSDSQCPDRALWILFPLKGTRQLRQEADTESRAINVQDDPGMYHYTSKNKRKLSKNKVKTTYDLSCQRWNNWNINKENNCHGF